jgi:uncharacterized 2Fe-2S/4Fe-4S cluster protein (DUF4445 family)
MEPVGRRVTIADSQSLLDAAQAAGVELAAVCGGVGVCGKCRIRLMTGELSPLSAAEREMLTEEQLSADHRLACQCRPHSDVKVDILPESLMSAQRLQVEGQEESIALDPAVVPYQVAVDPPDLDDLRADTTRLLAALAEAGISRRVVDLPVLQNLSDQLRNQNWRARLALYGDEIIGVLPDDRPLLGLAVDIGTTKLAAYLVDLQTGVTLQKGGTTNPQVAYGEDVLSRIAYANEHKDGRQVLQKALVDRLNTLVADLCTQTAVSCDQIVEAVLVGNTAMHHLFTGLPVRQLGFVPYVPAVSEPLVLSAREVGLNLAPGSRLYLPPNIAGFVGADHVAMLLATKVLERGKRLIAVDVGTNTEVSLVTGKRLLSCSCASGPAFEGAHIRDGMRAVPGAIEKVTILDGQVYIQTVGDKAPVGICGSGILDAIAQMFKAGILDRTGRMVCTDPVSSEIERCTEFRLVEGREAGHGQEIAVMLEDVREIQLAKGAIRAGLEILLKEANLTYADIDEFIIAGAFGTYLDVESAVEIGMFPPISLDRFQQVGNAAGIGAKWMLMSKAKRAEAAQLVERIRYVELTTHPAFTRTFAHALRF